MAINLIIKGNMFDAFTASHARGIALLTAAQQFREGPFSDVVASCADTNLDAVRAWFIASDGPAPYPVGALLFYSDKQSAAYNDERDRPRANAHEVAWHVSRADAAQAKDEPYYAAF
jgi:hypothetical protein